MSNEPLDLTRVYPRIKGVFDDENPDPAAKVTDTVVQTTVPDFPVFKRLAKGIGVFYGVDMDSHFQLVQNRHLTNNISVEDLHTAAMTNLANAIANKTDVRGDANSVMMVTNGGNFEATMILVDFLWEQLETALQDKVCIAIPANDLLFICRRSNSEGLDNLRTAIKYYFDEQETKGLIVRNIYERSDNSWVYLETA